MTLMSLLQYNLKLVNLSALVGYFKYPCGNEITTYFTKWQTKSKLGKCTQSGVHKL